VYDFRPFRNSDPPRLAEIWRDQPQRRWLMQSVTAGLLEQFVFSKPYFDPHGLIVAVQDGEPVGFVHAGFGPNEEESAVSTEFGTIYLLLLRSGHREPSLAAELLGRAESYLQMSGAKVRYAGGIRPLNAFYLGLYGGSELPGVLAGDELFTSACARCGFREIDRVVILRRDISAFRPLVSRVQRQLRRETELREQFAPMAKTWWEACTIGAFDRLCYSLAPTAGGPAIAEAWFWDIEPLSSAWGVPTAGLVDLFVASERRRQGVATYMLSEVLPRVASRGVARIEAQTMQSNAPALALYAKLGFEKIDEGVVYRKE
jgi:ribosomal protein S18 acetylase RimI-like enzyme